MLHLLHIKLQGNIKGNKRIKKGFTLVELVISIAIGATLILGTYNVLAQSLATIQDTTVAGTMDNYASAIQKRIRRELISSKYINLASTRHTSNTIKTGISGNQGYNYKNIYYANENELHYGIIYNQTENRISVAYYPEFNRYLSPEQQEFREIIVVFSEDGANGVKLEDFKWSIDEYNVSAELYNNPDYAETPTKMVKYQFTLSKYYTNGKPPLKKTYYFTEVLECAV